MANTIIRIGTVELVEGDIVNETDGLRIKVRMPQDGNHPIDEIPWAFPLLPKMFQTAPQLNEAVLIISAEANNTKSQRFYIGPIIPQPQFMEFAPEINGLKRGSSLLQGSEKEPLGKISNNNSTTGAFPKIDDVAVIGRGREDLRLKYNRNSQTSEADLTAGVRNKPHNSTNPDLTGNVIFNNDNPAYVQAKHGYGLSASGQAFVNIVGDKINLMSHKDDDVSAFLADSSHLVAEGAYDTMMKKLHPAVKGDKLIELLKLMIGAIKNHVHPWAGMEQCGDWAGYINELNKFDVDSIVSQDVRLS